MPDDETSKTPKAKVILPKVKKEQGGYRPGGPGGERLKDGHHAQTHDRKPPRLPGRNG